MDRTGGRAGRSSTARRRARCRLAPARLRPDGGGVRMTERKRLTCATTGATGATSTERQTKRSRRCPSSTSAPGPRTTLTAPLGASGFDVTLDGSMVTYTDVDENGNRSGVRDGCRRLEPAAAHRSRRTEWTVMRSPPAVVARRFDDRVLGVCAVGRHRDLRRAPQRRCVDRVTHEPKDVYEGGWASDRSFVYSISNPKSAYPLLARSIDLGDEGNHDDRA